MWSQVSTWLTAPERFAELLAVLEKLPQGGEADLPGAVERAPPMGTGRRTAVILSDFYEAEPLMRALAVLGRRTGTVLGGHVLAPEELRPPEDSVVRLRDAESGESVLGEWQLGVGPPLEELVELDHLGPASLLERRLGLAGRRDGDQEPDTCRGKTPPDPSSHG